MAWGEHKGIVVMCTGLKPACHLQFLNLGGFTVFIGKMRILVVLLQGVAVRI